MSVTIRRGSARFLTKVPGRATWHSLSFGEFYDPEQLSIGPMLCHDEHLLASGAGFEEHPHADIDIVTFVVSGALEHTDSLGTKETLEVGQAGLLRAGDGVQHSEIAVAPGTRFVQAWLRSDERTPSWSRVSTDRVDLPSGSLTVMTVASGETVSVPISGLAHLFVAAGGLRRNSLAEPLAAGDAMTFEGEPGDVEVTAAMDSTLMIWSLSA